MSIRVKREEIEAGRWYQVKQGSVLIPMFLDCWKSSTVAIMFTRSEQERHVSILNIVDGYDIKNMQLFELEKVGKPTEPGVHQVSPQGYSGCRQCRARAKIGSKLPKLSNRSIAFRVLEEIINRTLPDSGGITDEQIHSHLLGRTGGSVRGRRADLVKLGYVEASPVVGRTENGGKSKRWRVTNKGMVAYDRLAGEGISA